MASIHGVKSRTCQCSFSQFFTEGWHGVMRCSLVAQKSHGDKAGCKTVVIGATTKGVMQAILKRCWVLAQIYLQCAVSTPLFGMDAVRCTAVKAWTYVLWNSSFQRFSVIQVIQEKVQRHLKVWRWSHFVPHPRDFLNSLRSAKTEESTYMKLSDVTNVHKTSSMSATFLVSLVCKMFRFEHLSPFLCIRKINKFNKP